MIYLPQRAQRTSKSRAAGSGPAEGGTWSLKRLPKSSCLAWCAGTSPSRPSAIPARPEFGERRSTKNRESRKRGARTPVAADLPGPRTRLRGRPAASTGRAEGPDEGISSTGQCLTAPLPPLNSVKKMHNTCSNCYFLSYRSDMEWGPL